MVEEKQELLTPQQQSMWKARHRDERPKTATQEEKKAWNKGLRQKLSTMSAADLAKTRMALQAEWDAQPADQKEKKQQRIADKAKKSQDVDDDD